MSVNYQIATNITLNHILEKIEHLTFPPIRKKIQTLTLQEPFTGVWALEEKNILGVILADIKDNGVSELFSFYVKPEKRNNGIGSQLLTILEANLKIHGVKYIQSRYRNDWKNLEAIEKILHKNDWEKPVLIRVIAEGSIDSYTKVIWPDVKIPSDFTFIFSDEITPGDRIQIDKLIKSSQVPIEFAPFQHDDKIYKPATIFIKHKTNVIGWNIAYILRDDTIEYNNLYLLEDFRKRGYAIELLKRSFGEQYQNKIPKVTWIVNADNLPVMKMIKQIAGDKLSKYIEVRASRKILQ